MEYIDVLILIVLVAGPFLIAIMRKSPTDVELVPAQMEASGCTIYPTCPHCGWRGAGLDVTEQLQAASRGEAGNTIKTPPCPQCGQRIPVNLARLIRRTSAA